MGGLTVGGEEAEWTAGPSLDFTSLLDPCGCWPRALARQGREGWQVQETLLPGQSLCGLGIEAGTTGPTWPCGPYLQDSGDRGLLPALLFTVVSGPTAPNQLLA